MQSFVIDSHCSTLRRKALVASCNWHGVPGRQCNEGADVAAQLAHIHMSGLGVEVNCSKAAGFVRVVLQERSGWSEDIADAVAALDEGEPESPFVCKFAP